MAYSLHIQRQTELSFSMITYPFDTTATRRRLYVVDEEDNEEEMAVRDNKSPTMRYTIFIPSYNNDLCLMMSRR